MMQMGKVHAAHFFYKAALEIYTRALTEMDITVGNLVGVITKNAAANSGKVISTLQVRR